MPPDKTPMTIIPVTSHTAALATCPEALVMFTTETPEQAAARFRVRFGIDAATLYQWPCGSGIPCSEVVYQRGKKMSI